MYSLKNIFLQEPESVKGLVMTLLGLAVLTGMVHASGEVIAGIGLAVERLLGFFYVRPLTASKAGINALVADPEVKPLIDPAP